MILHTASEVVSFSKRIEEEGARFYEQLIERFQRSEDTLQRYAEENRRYGLQVQRAYYGVVTDALEGGFAFEIEEDKYSGKTKLPDNATYREALEGAIKMEERIMGFYLEAAGQSRSLMADLTRAFSLVARKRENRVGQLESMLDEGMQARKGSS
jgi:rubrerythrin